MTTTIESGADILDVRDIIARVEELREERDSVNQEFEDAKGSESPALIEVAEDALVTYLNSEEHAELTTLESLLDDLKGCGGDEQWEGDWYPVTLIHENYFVEAMKDLVQDFGDLPKEIPAYLEIDWDKTAENLKVDYSTVDFDGNEYYYR